MFQINDKTRQAILNDLDGTRTDAINALHEFYDEKGGDPSVLGKLGVPMEIIVQAFYDSTVHLAVLIDRIKELEAQLAEGEVA